MSPATPRTSSIRDLILRYREIGKYDEFVAGISHDPVRAVEILFRPHNDPYPDRPFLWRGRDVLHPGQAEILEAIFKDKSRFIAIATGHGVGKTFLVKIIPVLWLITHYNGGVLLSAASWEALHGDIIPGMRAVMLRAPVCLRPYPGAQSLVWGDEWRVEAISPFHPESAQGKHPVGGILVLVDEASKLSSTMFNPLLSNCTGEEDCMVLPGNPLHSDGPFADILLGRTGAGAEPLTVKRDDGSTFALAMSGWRRMHISSLDSPNVVAGKDIYPGLMSRTGLAQMIAKYGQGTPEYQARIEGVVPDQDENVYIARSTLEACARRATIPWQEDQNLVLGVDVARSLVGDQTVLVVRGDHSLHHFEAHRGLDETAVLRRILEVREKFVADPSKRSLEHSGLLDEWTALEANEKRTDPRKKAKVDDLVNRLHLALNADRSSAIEPASVHVDGTGLGSGLCDRLERLGYPPSVRVIAAGQADDPLGCANRRAECWKHLKKGLESLAIPEDFLRHLMGTSTLRYKHDVKNRLLIESKEDYKDRNERSPDEADALALTYYREPGALAFSAASQCHALRSAPTIRPGFETVKGKRHACFLVNYDGYLVEVARPGYLCRATWLARREKSACVWVHADRDGYWTVFDSLLAENLTTRIFWERVLDKSMGHRYQYDVFSCPEGTEAEGERHLERELWQITRHESKPANRTTKTTVGAPVPQFVEPKRILGIAGLETLDSLLLATLSWYPSNPYWREHNLNHMDFRSEKRIGIWPREVLEALTRSRLTEHGWKDETLTEDPESLVAQGGPLVRCLRLLAISGAGQ